MMGIAGELGMRGMGLLVRKQRREGRAEGGGKAIFLMADGMSDSIPTARPFGAGAHGQASYPIFGVKLG